MLRMKSFPYLFHIVAMALPLFSELDSGFFEGLLALNDQMTETIPEIFLEPLNPSFEF
jgi:hypothetical protein